MRNTLFVLSLVGALVAGLRAQQLSSPPSADSTQKASSPLPQSATFRGTIRDTSGVALPGAHVTLTGQNDAFRRTITADPEGSFLFSGVPPGSYRVSVEAPGLEPFTSGAVELAAGEVRDFPVTSARMSVQTTTVNVTASIEQVAEAQVKQEEEQRIFGLLPNYYTSYIWDAAPMSPKQKFGMARRTLTDPVSFLVTAGIAGSEQWHKTFPGYGQEAGGYAKRFGATYADTVASRMFGSAIYPTIFHQDPRYYYRGSGSVGSRILYALKYTVICRGDNGQIEPNYSHILGSFTAAGISNLYKTPQDRQAGLTFRNGLIITASGAAVNLMREFLFRQITPKVPSFANGKP